MKIGKYALLDLVATGGMAELWLARQEGPAGFARTVAIKRVLPHLASDKRFVEMFLDEARLAALLTHPNIVQIFDFGESDGEYFLAMEFIRGRSLDEVLDQQSETGGNMPLEMAAYIVGQACLGLSYAHRFRNPETGEHLQLVHRDVSPQNVMVSFEGMVKVMDFGIAKATTSRVKTQTGMVKGKYAYMSPEQIGGSSDLDARSDVFALGIVLYESITGVRPFGTQSDLVAITAILNEPPKPIRQFVPNVDEGIEKVLERCLAKDRDDRYPDARSMHADLDAYLRTHSDAIGSEQVERYLAALFGVTEQTDTAPGAPSDSADSAAPEEAEAGQKSFAYESTVVQARPSPAAAAAEGADDEGPSTVVSASVVDLPTVEEPSLSIAAIAVDSNGPGPPVPRDSSGAGRGVFAAAGLLLLAALGGGGWWLFGRGAPPPKKPAAPAVSTKAAPAPKPADPHAGLETTLMSALSEGRGLLRIEAPTGTAVFLDGRSLGGAPVPPEIVTSGSHVVRGLPPTGTPWEGSITVLSMKKAVLRIP